jgi:hypothetical protein
MEIFVRNIPTDRNPRVIRRYIKNAIKAACGDNIAFDWRPFAKRYLAVLTFATPELGNQFLRVFARGLDIHGKTVLFCISNKEANPWLVKSLKVRTEDMKQWPDESEEEGIVTKNEVSFTSIEWGVWATDGSFGHCGTIHRSGVIARNASSRQVEVRISETDGNGNSGEPPDDNGIVIDNTIVQEVLIDRSAVQPRLYLTFDRVPLFWSSSPQRHTSLDQEPTDELSSLIKRLAILYSDSTKYRLPALCSQHSPDAPYCTVYAFNLDGVNLERSLKRLFKSMRWTFSEESSFEIPTYPISLTTGLKQLSTWYVQTEYRVAFQMELFLRNHRLIPDEIVGLQTAIRRLTRLYSVDTTVRILQDLASRLPIRTFEGLSHGLDIHQLLGESETSQRNWTPSVDGNSAWIHRLGLTPAAYNLDGPDWMGSNRVLRLFPGHHDHFLKVSFLDEDLSPIHYSREYDLTKILKGSWTAALDDWHGINLGGRQFHFLGFSGSSLREHSAWFLSPFEKGGNRVTAQSVRAQLGDFSSIRCPPRLAARIGQAFTSTSHSLELSPGDVKRIPDVQCGPYVFSDGVGTISQSVLDKIWGESNTGDETKPVAYQIRLGGAKGVVSLDNTLQGDLVCLRESMIKFPAPLSHLELANRGRVLPFFLNRQMIVILESLKLPMVNFLTLLDTEVKQLEKASREFEPALNLFQRYGLGQATGLSGILTALQSSGVQAIFQIPFFRRVNDLALNHALKQIKYHARIPVEKSWTLMGIMDEFGYLEPDEIYVCLRNDREGTVYYLEGDTAVTRMPALHCGDIQKLRAVCPINSGSLAAIYNCIVFPAKGDRPVPNMLSGGDLDGDLFQVTQNPLLFPPTCAPPGSFPAVAPKNLQRDCTINDIADFFIDFIISDRLSQISHMHLLLADQSPNGAHNPDCVKLSQLASTAVDFPKTGVAVNMADAPKVNMTIKPDFMAWQPLSSEDLLSLEAVLDSSTVSGRRSGTLYYRSEKALGELYRRVDIPSLMRSWNASSGINRDGEEHVWNTIQSNLDKLVPPYLETWEKYIEEATELFAEYMEEFKMIQLKYHPRPWRSKRLSEAEVFLQCIEMDTSKRVVRGRDREDYLRGLKKEYGSLVESVRSRLNGEDGKFRRAAACFYIGVRKPRKGREGESFGWITVPDLSDAWEQVRENGFVDSGMAAAETFTSDNL